MPRIRTIKPEFWDSPSTARASAVARLAFIGMWNWADDFGRGTANLKELEGFIFPNDDVRELSHGTSENFRAVVAEVAECFGVEFYSVSGRPYYAIPSWEAHQRNERRAKSKFPGPDEADSPLTWDDAPNHGDARKFRDTVAEVPKSSGTGTGEQGNRGTGEQGSSAPTERGDARAATPPAKVVEAEPVEAEPAETAQTIIAAWIEACGDKRPAGRLIGQLSKEVKALLDEGQPYGDVLTAVQAWHSKGVHPSVLPSVLHEVRHKRAPATSADRRLQAGMDRHLRLAQTAPPAQGDPFDTFVARKEIGA